MYCHPSSANSSTRVITNKSAASITILNRLFYNSVEIINRIISQEVDDSDDKPVRYSVDDCAIISSYDFVQTK